jgi:predicted Mrr-cat superfamily restriction endonuclease
MQTAQREVRTLHAGEIEGESEIRRDTEQRALGFLQDKLSKLDWDEMQELVAWRSACDGIQDFGQDDDISVIAVTRTGVVEPATA